MLSQTTASEHFIIKYQDEDEQAVDKIIDLLESNYKRITSFLQVELVEKVMLHVYPSIEKLHEGIGRARAPDWVVGNFIYVRPYAFTRHRA